MRKHLLEGKKIQYKDNDIVFLRGCSLITIRQVEEVRHEWSFLNPNDWAIYEEPKPKKKVTLYRYTYEYSGNILESNFISRGWGDYKSRGDKLLLTESKEIEVDE